jgi:hypothetical protein
MGNNDGAMGPKEVVPAPILGVVPHHCKQLANKEELQPLVEALAEVQGSQSRAVEIQLREPEQVEGIEAIIQFLLHAASDPLVLGTGVFAGAALKRFGEKFADWVCETFQQRWGHGRDTLISTTTIIPPPDVPKERRFPITAQIEIGPKIEHELKSVIAIEFGKSGVRGTAELRERLGEEFNNFEGALKPAFQAMRNGDVPPGIIDARVERDYRLYARNVQEDGTQVSFYGTILPDGKIVWEKV